MNSSEPVVTFEDDRYIIIASVAVVFILGIIVLNSMVLYTTFADKCISKFNFSVCYASLASADLITGFISIPIVLDLFFPDLRLTLSPMVCFWIEIITCICISSSTITLIIISVVQYVMIAYPFFYRKCMRGEIITALCISSWGIGSAVIIPTFLDLFTNDGKELQYCHVESLFGKNVKYFNTVQVGLFCLLLPTMAVLNCLSLKRIKHRSKHRRRRPSCIVANPLLQSKSKRDPSSALSTKYFNLNSQSSDNTTTENKVAANNKLINTTEDLRINEGQNDAKNEETQGHKTKTMGNAPEKDEEVPHRKQRKISIRFQFDECNAIRIDAHKRDRIELNTFPHLTIITPKEEENTPLKDDNMNIKSTSDCGNSMKTVIIPPAHSRRMSRKVRRPEITILLIIVVFVCLIGPHIGLTFFELVIEEMGDDADLVFIRFIMFVCVLGNAFVNPLIYTFRVQVYKNGIKAKLTQLKSKLCKVFQRRSE